jgi:PAS domain S-box-containing protein
MPASALAELLIVDDETAQMRALCETLESEGYSTTGFTSAQEALETLRHRDFDLVLTDLMMPEMDGIAMLRAAFEIDPNLVGIVMTGHGTIDTAIEALKTGALDYILKPFRLSAILPLLKRARAVQQLRQENIQLREALGIHELGIDIAFAPDFATILEKAADAAFRQSHARDVSILLPAGKKELRVAVARGQDADRIQGKIIPAGDTLTGRSETQYESWTAQGLDAISATESLAEVIFGDSLSPSETHVGVSIPMVTGRKLVGILNFTSNHLHRALPPGQVKALSILAGSTASALEAASLMEQLRGAEQRYRRLAESAPDVVFRCEVHPQRSFTFVNPAMKDLTGYAPEEHYQDPDLILRMTHPDDRPVTEAILRGGYASGDLVTTRWVRKQGGVIWVEQRNVVLRDAEGRVVAIEGIIRDITDRRNLEEQLRHSQKMEAIGRLAAGVAHDFNNLLTVINGYSDLALKEMTPDGASYRKIDEVRKAGEQAAVLTRQLLASGRKQVSQPKILNLNAVVDNSLNMLRRLMGSDVKLTIDEDAGLAQVKADEGQIQQILMNLSVNARDAMPEGGELRVQTRNTDSSVMLAISDTGSGMDADTQALIFEPFFTTKELGKGTGLGLAIVHGIVKQSGGSISVESEPGKGTTFRIDLPRVA